MGNSGNPIFDLFVIGGGINGVGIANDAAGRGLKVGLCDKGDLGGATSSASSKLIHGGLRYLEHFDFRLVKEALAEREVMLKKAPHIATPMRFCLPHRPQLRPAWLIRTGLFIYDHLSRRTTLPSCKMVDFSQVSPLNPAFKKGFEYSDVWIDDARLVVLNAMQLKQLGGDVRTYTEVLDASRREGHWHIHWRDLKSGAEETVRSRVLVNAAGPWVQQVLESTVGIAGQKTVCLVKGSHIVVPAMHNERRAFILQCDDGRIVFVLPYLNEFSLVGTTDVEFSGDPSEASCSSEEVNYLCGIVNRHFNRQISPNDVIWSYSGVRSLCQDDAKAPQAITRDYAIEMNDQDGKAPLVSIFGGKLTTYRKLGEAVVDELASYFPGTGPCWTKTSVLPGGEGVLSPATYTSELLKEYPWLTKEQALRYSSSYGSLAHCFLTKASSFSDLGEHFGAGLTSKEVDYLIESEWACSVEDILWRRSKLGLGNVEVQSLGRYLESRLPVL
ncbi:glycerol-3-phosphate dehydrogenase [Endozoicomonas sp. Mp262]|uniref:glycerol-3-phosphate dehydrogenase n=1 Tax=Endozoicomonas sp. Mp262 TaxID=2919499 RepID=UPI0021E0334C